MNDLNKHKKISKAVFPKIPKPTSPQEIPHQQPSPGADLPDVRLNALPSAQSAMDAMRTGGLHPALDYTPETGESNRFGNFESDETVAAKAKYRQEFPR